MGKLLIASNNAGKVKEIKEILSGFYGEIVSLKDEGINIEVEEDGDTFEKNAKKKAYEISLIADCDVLADDSGLAVDGLNGAPGVYSQRYSKGGDKANNDKLISNVTNLSEKDRRARFICVMALYRKGEEILLTSGECEGVIITTPRGEGGFGYDPIFFVKEYGKTMAELSPSAKNSISHRSRALLALKSQLENKKIEH